MTTTFPVTDSTLSASTLGEFIRHKYNLSEKTECKLFRTGMNHLYIVTDGKMKYAFRVYTFNWRTKLEIAEELRLLIHLKENDAPVTYPIANQSNEFIQEFNAPEGKRFGVLFSFANGTKTAKFTPQTSYFIGQALAKVHKSSENFVLNRITYDTQTLVVDSVARTSQFFKKNSEEISFLEKTADYLQREFKNVDKHQLRYGAVHLDVWFDNMHFDGENNVTLFDFDFCGNGWLCLDISYFLFQLFTTNQNDTDYQIKADSFFKGYETVTEISKEERRILPFACLAIMTFYISMQCDRYDSWTNIFLNEDHLKRFVGNLKRWAVYNTIKIE
jgi:Ser/Thr protein kinase RdoA (MazF antagonist)